MRYLVILLGRNDHGEPIDLITAIVEAENRRLAIQEFLDLPKVAHLTSIRSTRVHCEEAPLPAAVKS